MAGAAGGMGRRGVVVLVAGGGGHAGWGRGFGAALAEAEAVLFARGTQVVTIECLSGTGRAG